MDNDRDGNAKHWPMERARSPLHAYGSANVLNLIGSPVDEAIISALEHNGAYRVLKRLQPPPPIEADEGDGVMIALDLETTGLNHGIDEIIELGMVRVRYDTKDGRILGIEGSFSALREPSLPLPEHITRLTGLRPADLAGGSIDPDDVALFVQGARLVVAHNAGFDRRFAEAAWPLFARLPWADSYTQADLSVHGYEGARLGHLVLQSGFFHDGHRAIDDVFAMLHVLGRETHMGTPFKSLLVNARTPASRVWADGAPFASRSLLKARQYRWSDGSNGAPRAWYRDVPSDDADAEATFLREDVLNDADACPRIVPISAYDRFTDRAGLPAAQPRVS